MAAHAEALTPQEAAERLRRLRAQRHPDRETRPNTWVYWSAAVNQWVAVTASGTLYTFRYLGCGACG